MERLCDAFGVFFDDPFLVFLIEADGGESAGDPFGLPFAFGGLVIADCDCVRGSFDDRGGVDVRPQPDVYAVSNLHGVSHAHAVLPFCRGLCPPRLGLLCYAVASSVSPRPIS